MRIPTLTVTKGKAIFQDDGLRCHDLRKDKSKEGHSRICNKLIVKANALGEIAGNYRCERCRQEIEVVIAPRT